MGVRAVMVLAVTAAERNSAFTASAETRSCVTAGILNAAQNAVTTTMRQKTRPW